MCVSLTVLGGEGPLATPTWYLVGADDTLRVVRTVRTPATPAPPVVRVLGRSEVFGVWQRSRALLECGAPRVADEADGLPATSVLPLHAAVLAITAQGSVRTFVIRPTAPDRPAADGWGLAGALAGYLETLSEARDPSQP